MIINCKNCPPHEQDNIHGYKNRVHNPCKNLAKARCTVCGSEKELLAEQIKKLKEGE